MLALLPEPRAAQEALRRLGLPSTPAVLSPPRCWSQDELDLPRDYGGIDPPFFDDAAQLGPTFVLSGLRDTLWAGFDD